MQRPAPLPGFVLVAIPRARCSYCNKTTDHCYEDHTKVWAELEAVAIFSRKSPREHMICDVCGFCDDCQDVKHLFLS